MSLKLQNVSSNYCIGMTVRQFEQLERSDFLTVVRPQLLAAGAERIEYSGHFGANLFFTAPPSKAQEVFDTVKRLVNRRAAGVTLQASKHARGSENARAN